MMIFPTAPHISPGFLILIGYRGEYRPRVRARGEIERIRERDREQLARERAAVPQASWRVRMNAQPRERAELSASLPPSVPPGDSDSARAAQSRSRRGIPLLRRLESNQQE